MVRLLCNVLHQLEIEVEHCPDRVQASHKMAQKRFDAVIVDCDHDDDFSLLQSVRFQHKSRNSLSVAIIDGNSDLQAAFSKGADFVVYKPIHPEKAESSFRAARVLMRRERRRSARLPTNIPADFRFADGVAAQATISGLSENGVSVCFSGPTGKPGVVGFCFYLPETDVMIAATGTIAWQDSRHRTGIQFATITESSRRSLKEWLRARSTEKPPGLEQ